MLKKPTKSIAPVKVLRNNCLSVSRLPCADSFLCFWRLQRKHLKPRICPSGDRASHGHTPLGKFPRVSWPGDRSRVRLNGTSEGTANKRWFRTTCNASPCSRDFSRSGSCSVDTSSCFPDPLLPSRRRSGQRSPPPPPLLARPASRTDRCALTDHTLCTCSCNTLDTRRRWTRRGVWALSREVRRISTWCIEGWIVII